MTMQQYIESLNELLEEAKNQTADEELVTLFGQALLNNENSSTN
ncbi:hypothetical protein [Halalkalibacterium ligniniphilum]|nr:hypothetical protein [Halalkalibacterium ligniniphilum]